MTSDRLRSGTGDEIGIGSGHTYEDTVRKVRGVAHLRYCPHSCLAFTALEVFPFFRWVRCPMCDICLRCSSSAPAGRRAAIPEWASDIRNATSGVVCAGIPRRRVLNETLQHHSRLTPESCLTTRRDATIGALTGPFTVRILFPAPEPALSEQRPGLVDHLRHAPPQRDEDDDPRQHELDSRGEARLSGHFATRRNGASGSPGGPANWR